jgi:hypothetical protein
MCDFDDLEIEDFAFIGGVFGCLEEEMEEKKRIEKEMEEDEQIRQENYEDIIP